MEMRNKYLMALLSLAMAICSCGKEGNDREENVIDVSDQIQTLDTEDVLIGKSSDIYVYGDRLYIVDTRSNDLILHAYDTESGKYIGSALKPGPSPYEISRPGALGVDASTGDAIMFDYGQNRIVTFNVDSVLSDSTKEISTLRNLDMSGFPDSYIYVNDSTGYGRLIIPDGKDSYSQTVCRYDVATGDLKKFGKSEAVGEGNRSAIAVSPDGKTIVEACRTQDLIVLYDTEGNPIKEIKGKAYEPIADRSMSYFTGVSVTGNHILTAYSGNKADKGFYGDRIMVFDLDGHYVKSLKLGIEIRKMAYSPDTDNLYISTPDSIQFGFIPLAEIGGLTN